MKKKLDKIITIILTVVMLTATIIPQNVGAENSISPYLLNTDKCVCSFSASTGTAYVNVTYDAKVDVFSHAKISVKIPKRFLGIFWSTVDIGYTDNEWIAYNYDTDGYFSNSFPLEDTGTYRAVFTVEIYGKDGSVDTIEDKITSTYD